MTAAVPAGNPARPKTPPDKGDTNVKETIESILVAFILAFIFRCFVIEAFVIPTGSMAPTLLGAHMQMRCPDCGYRFTVGSNESTDATYSIDSHSKSVFTIFCPNCAYRIPRRIDSDPDHDASQPPLRYGDRILVMKYLYLLHGPQRWDVAVFKTPDPGRDHAGDYSINYIKRLIGLPGESLMIAEGDIYVAPPGADPSLPDNFKIQSKPRPAQEALWRIVHDSDHVPVGLERKFDSNNGMPSEDPKWETPWHLTSGEGWRIDHGRVFQFENAAGAGELSFRADENAHNSPLTDWLAYDQSHRPEFRFQPQPIDTFGLPGYGLARGGPYVQPVSDLKLACVVDRLEGEGTLQLHLEKTPDRFTAELSRDKIRVLRVTPQETVVLGEGPLSQRFPLQVEFENVDHRVALRINGTEVLVSSYPPDVAEIMARARDGGTPPQGRAQIRGDRVTAQLSHVQLWRDVYYLDRDAARATPRNVLTLGQKEYFVLGDNSYQSEDARYWRNGVELPDENLTVEPGRVPDRFMLGKAFFVYWPAGYRPLGSVPPIIPNFGEMRLIR